LPHLVLNVPALARRSESEIERYLGMADPAAATTSMNSTKRSYRSGRIEVVFVDAEARWIKLYTTKELPFSKEALAKLGLPVRRPTYDNSPHVLSWHNIPHLKEVSLYGGGPNGWATSVLICVQTAPARAAARRLSFPGLRARAHSER
jgi:hypothetical protein